MQGQLKKTTFWLMMSVGVLFDLAQAAIGLLHFIPAAGNAIAGIGDMLITIVAGLTFFLWFWLHGIRFNTSKRMLRFGGSFLVELIPVANMLPVWTTSVLLIYFTTKHPQAAKLLNGGPNPSKNTKGKVGTAAQTTSTLGKSRVPNGGLQTPGRSSAFTGGVAKNISGIGTGAKNIVRNIGVNRGKLA